MVEFSKDYSKSLDMFLNSVYPMVQKYKWGLVVIWVLGIGLGIFAVASVVIFSSFAYGFPEIGFNDNFPPIYTKCLYVALALGALLAGGLFWQENISKNVRVLVLKFLADIKTADEINNLKDMISQTGLYEGDFYGVICDGAFAVPSGNSEYFVHLIKIKKYRKVQSRYNKTYIAHQGVLYVFDGINVGEISEFVGKVKYYSSFFDEDNDKLYVLTEYEYRQPILKMTSRRALKDFAKKNCASFAEIMNFAEKLLGTTE